MCFGSSTDYNTYRHVHRSKTDCTSRLYDVTPLTQPYPFYSSGRIILGRSHVARVAEARVDQINKYCQALIKLPSYISESKHVISFFSALPGDVRLPPYVVGAVRLTTHAHICNIVWSKTDVQYVYEYIEG